MARIDGTAVVAAAGAGLAVILPGAALSAVLSDRVAGGVVWLYLAIVLVGFGLAGLVAGRLRTDTPLAHGAAGAGAAFIVAAIIGLLLAAVRDQSIGLVALPVAALAAVTAGVGGALVADVLRRRGIRQQPNGG